MNNLPDRAISIRQPWAWAIMNAGKDIENRPQRWKYRGLICIHASKYKNQSEYDIAENAITDNCDKWPPAMLSAGNITGGIIGVAEIVDCVTESDSPWFFGPYGLVLKNVRPVKFIPVRGALGPFKWRGNLI